MKYALNLLLIFFTISCIKDSPKKANKVELPAHVKGTFENCFNHEGNSSRHSYEFTSETRFIETETYYQGLNCQQGRATHRDVFHGDYRFNNESRLFSDRLYRLFYTIYGTDELQEANDKSHCGFNDWVIGQERDLTEIAEGLCIGGDFRPFQDYWDRTDSEIGSEIIVISGKQYPRK